MLSCDSEKNKFLSRYYCLGGSVIAKNCRIKNYYFEKLNSNPEMKYIITCSMFSVTAGIYLLSFQFLETLSLVVARSMSIDSRKDRRLMER